jgi:hypothetical protein
MKSRKPTQAAPQRYPGSPNTRALPEYWSQPIASRHPHDFTTQHSPIDAGSVLGWVDRALRGAGTNFGVTTSLECRLYALGTVTSGDIYYPLIFGSPYEIQRRTRGQSQSISMSRT